MTAVFQVDVGNEVFAAPSIRIEAVGEAAECGDRQCVPLRESRGNSHCFINYRFSNTIML